MNIHDVCVKRKHVRKRVGRGTGSGHGKTAGKGGKGQSARVGGRSKFPNMFFEGGQMPLVRRMPKRGFSNVRFRKDLTAVNLYRLAAFVDGETVSEATLKAKGVISGSVPRVKILGKGDIKVRLTFSVAAVSKSAAVKILAAGGTVPAAIITAPPVPKPKPVPAPKAEKGAKGDKGPKGEKPAKGGKAEKKAQAGDAKGGEAKKTPRGEKPAGDGAAPAAGGKN